MSQIIGDPQHGFGGGIVIQDLPCAVHHDHSLADGVEHGIKESLFPREMLHKGVHTSGVQSFQLRHNALNAFSGRHNGTTPFCCFL